MGSRMEDFVPTRVSQLNPNATSNFVSIRYEAHKKKQKDPNKTEETKAALVSSKKQGKEMDPRKQQELEMKKARYEVIKFGISGFSKSEAKKAKIGLAVSLGAKTKNRKMNYKKLQEQRKMKKKEETLQTSGLNNSLVKHKMKKKKKHSDGILGVYGKVEKGVPSKARR